MLTLPTLTDKRRNALKDSLGMKQAQGITEHLKAENALDWIGRLNNIRANVRQIVNKEIIYI